MSSKLSYCHMRLLFGHEIFLYSWFLIKCSTHTWFLLSNKRIPPPKKNKIIIIRVFGKPTLGWGSRNLGPKHHSMHLRFGPQNNYSSVLEYLLAICYLAFIIRLVTRNLSYHATKHVHPKRIIFYHNHTVGGFANSDNES